MKILIDSLEFHNYNGMIRPELNLLVCLYDVSDISLESAEI